MNLSEVSFPKMLPAALILSVSLWGCATNQHNFADAYSFSDVGSAKELHLQQEAKSLKMETPKELPEMTCDEYERLGDVYFSRGDLGTAFVQYDKALKLNPDNSNIHYKKGLLLVIGNMNENSILEFRQVLRNEPAHALSHEGLGLAYFQMKKYDEAEACFRKASELDSTLWRTHNFLGVIYDYKKQYKKAIREYQEAVALKQNNGVFYNNMGISYFLAGDYQKAIAAFNRGLSTKSTDSRLSNNLGLVLAEMGRYREALEAFRKGGNEAQAYNNLGCIYLKHGKYEKAKRCFEKAIELKPLFYAKASENARKARVNHGSSFDLTVETSFDDGIPAREIKIKKRTWKKPNWVKGDNKVKENALMPFIAKEVDAKQ
ncbi:MAG: tetratricopeptide repeat protein [Syntrophobacterales bacterium]|jgi:Flp pilus assembly protein TadD